MGGNSDFEHGGSKSLNSHTLRFGFYELLRKKFMKPNYGGSTLNLLT